MSDSPHRLQAAWKLHQVGQVDTASEVYRDVIDREPSNADAWVYLGIALFDHRDFKASVDAYRRAIKLKPHFPVGWNNLGNSLRMLGEVDQADECFEEALLQQPGYLSALKNRGTLWVWTGDIERGMRWYQRALKVDGNNAELHRNLGVIELLRGNFDIGWREYRWRWRMPGLYRPSTTAPVWQGQPLEGKTVLLYPEQGLGDAIQFVRVAKWFHQQGATVILQCGERFVNLFSSTTQTLGVDRLTLDSTVPPPADYHASLIEAVDVIYQQTGEISFGHDSFDSSGRYLTVSDALFDYWKSWFDKHLPRVGGRHPLRVGINWQGNPDHHADVYRSIPLSELAPLAALPDVQLVNLQFGFGSEQLDMCHFATSVCRLPNDIDQEGGAFTDTTAILANLDCVVTTDTAIAHLAGATGTPTHLMLGRVPDWRWLLSGTSTPWYPTMTLHRQSELGCWSDVVESIVTSLTKSV